MDSMPQLLMLQFILLYVSNTFRLLFLSGTEGVRGQLNWVVSVSEAVGKEENVLDFPRGTKSVRSFSSNKALVLATMEVLFI